jgi:hypothetical protein
VSALNTFFNGQTARNTAATARATGQIASAGRRWELQQRGWITPASTPAEIGAVEAILQHRCARVSSCRTDARGRSRRSQSLVGSRLAS